MKTLKIVAAVLFLIIGIACKQEPKSSNDNESKPCFVENPKGHTDVKSVELLWDAASRPFVASGYAKDTASGNVINFDEIVAGPNPYEGRILYHSGCVINIMVRISNEGKAGKAHVKIHDGDGNKCEKREEYVRALRCDLTTNR